MTPSRYVSGRIVEYDIKAANINVLFYMGKISEEEYRKLSMMEKIDREVTVGNWIKEGRYKDADIQEGIGIILEQFIRENHIQKDEIIRIANDAIYIDRMVDLTHLKYGNVEIRPKLRASNMVVLGKVIIFSWYDNNNINIEVKGLGQNMYLHQQYLLSIIANTIFMFERVGVDEAIQYLTEFYEHYIHRELPPEYYRTFDSFSCYITPYPGFSVTEVSDVSMIDIGYNLTVLRELFSILMENFN